MTGRWVGVEEELLLVDPTSGVLRPVSDKSLLVGTLGLGDGSEPQIKRELFLEQVEIASRPCETLTDLDVELRRGRRLAAGYAADAGAALAGVATAAVAVDATLTPNSRYQRMATSHSVTARDSLICGMHVHVEVADDEEAVAVLDRIRPWLPALLALSANSPFWHGEDSGYASFRAQVIGRWPAAGQSEHFGDAAAYHAAVADIIRSTAALDEAMIAFDARLSARFPTLEVRVADVCTEVETAVLIAALARGLVETAARHHREGRPERLWRVDLLRAATWQASRWGLAQDLVHPGLRMPRPAFEVLAALVDHVGTALDEAGDTGRVCARLDELTLLGTGSVRQRAVFAREARGEDVLLDAVERTRASYS